MGVSIRHVETHHVQQIWPMVEGFLAAALDKGQGPSDYNIHHVQAYLTGGNWLLLVAVDDDGAIVGAGSVSFQNYPLNRVAFFTTMGGKFITDAATVEQVKQLLKLRGATKIQGLMRPAMERLFAKHGFEARSKIVEVMI